MTRPVGALLGHTKTPPGFVSAGSFKAKPYRGQLHPEWGGIDATEEDLWLADLDSRTEWAVKRGLATALPKPAPEAPAGDADCLCVKCSKPHTDCSCDATGDDEFSF